MRFKLDENLPVELAQLFREAGHDAVTVLDQGLGGAGDSELAAICLREGRTIVTTDLDFSDIRAYPPRCQVPSGWLDPRAVRILESEKLLKEKMGC